MREVEVRIRGWRVGEALGDMRKWLDHNQCTPESFDITRAATGAVLIRITFTEDDIAEAFRRDFSA